MNRPNQQFVFVASLVTERQTLDTAFKRHRKHEDAMTLNVLLILFFQISNPIARDGLANYDDKLPLLVIKDPPLGYGKHKFDCANILRFPWVGTISEPVFEVEFDEKSFTPWNGKIRNLPLSLSKIRDRIIQVVNDQDVLRGSENSIWLLNDVVLWSVSEEREHFCWVASFKEDSKSGQSYAATVPLFFHLNGTLIKPRCIDGEERRFRSYFGANLE